MTYIRRRRCRDVAILDLVQPEVGPFDPPVLTIYNPWIRRPRKPYHRTKHEVDRMTRCQDMAVRNFPKWEVGRSSVINITLHYVVACCICFVIELRCCQWDNKALHYITLHKLQGSWSRTSHALLLFHLTKFEYYTVHFYNRYSIQKWC